jgi:uncharacterized protein (TIGR02996 family)
MSPELLALLRACKQAPDDDTPRLILADWLEDNGRVAHGQLMRLQVRAARMSLAECLAADTERQTRVLAAGCTLFLDQLQEAGVTARFRRGLLAVSPPLDLSRSGVRGLARSEAWAWVESAELVGRRWGAAGLRSWREASLLADVPEWRLVGPHLDADMADELTRPDAPAPLALAMQCYRTFPDAVGRLCRGPLAAGLRSLSLEHCRLRRPACAALAAGDWRLSELSLDGNRTGDVGCDELSAARWLPALSCLQVSGCNIGQRGLKVLLRAGVLRGLSKLDLSENRLGNAGASAIASAALPNLRELNLALNSITEAGALALVASPHLDGLTRLSLRGNRMGRNAELELEDRFGRRVSF